MCDLEPFSEIWSQLGLYQVTNNVHVRTDHLQFNQFTTM